MSTGDQDFFDLSHSVQLQGLRDTIRPSSEEGPVGCCLVQVGDPSQDYTDFRGRNFVEGFVWGSQAKSARLERMGFENKRRSTIPAPRIFLPLDFGVKKKAANRTRITKVSGMAKKLKN